MGLGYWGVPIRIADRGTNPYDNAISTKDTVYQMIALARRAANYPLVTSAVDSCLRKLHNKSNKLALCRAIFWFVKGRVKFRLDEDVVYNELGKQDWNQELLIDPGLLLSMPNPQGDCDDFSLLCASMLCAAHIKCGFVTIAADSSEPQRFSHIYVVAYLGSGQRFPLDCSHGSLPGWETKHIFKIVEWVIN
jgi:hypothetical protein